MKKITILILVIIGLILFLSFVKDIIIRISVENAVELITGLKLNIGSFNVGIVKTSVDIKDIKLFNPKGFNDRIMLDMPQAYVDYDLPQALKGNVHLEEMRIDLKEFVVVKNEQGQLNIDSLKEVKEQKEGKKPQEKEKKAPKIQIDKLQLKIGKVIYKDYSQGSPAKIEEFNINIDERYTNITNPNALVSLIVVRALVNTTISRLTDFDLDGLQGTVSDVFGRAQTKALEATTKAEEVLKETSEKVQKAAEGLTKALGFPFGSKEEK